MQARWHAREATGAHRQSHQAGAGGAPLCTAGAGYDGPTGLGTPQGTSAFSLRTASSTRLTSSTNPSTFGQPVTFTAAVTSAGGAPTGNVTFSSDGVALGTVGLAGGQTILTTSGLSIGSHAISASYAGDTNVLRSGATLIQTVNATPPVEGWAIQLSIPL